MFRIDEFLQDSNSDRETEETKISFNSKKDAKCQQSFIKEENEEDVIDLMDSRAARCIVGMCCLVVSVYWHVL